MDVPLWLQKTPRQTWQFQSICKSLVLPFPVWMVSSCVNQLPSHQENTVAHVQDRVVVVVI